MKSFSRLKNGSSLTSEVKTEGGIHTSIASKTTKLTSSLTQQNVFKGISKIPFKPTSILIDGVLLSKSLTDFFSSSDILQIIINKGLTETITISDVINILIQKELRENFTTEDSGSIFSQNYTVDNSYFAEQYVGTVKTF